MKQMLIALTLIFAARAAHASILLTTPYVVSGPAGGKAGVVDLKGQEL